MISKRIRELMTNKGLNIPEFARELGENRYRIQNILNKKQKVPEDVIVKMVEVFNVNATWLITGNGPIYSEIKEINEDRVGYGAGNSPMLADILDDLKNHWAKLSDVQKNVLVGMVKEMIEKNEMREFVSKLGATQLGELLQIPSLSESSPDS
jgi:transcriptional regulator with XRE-family HTH domain